VETLAKRPPIMFSNAYEVNYLRRGVY